MFHYKRVLTIAGSDPSGGAGIQADLKTFAAIGCYGMSAITAVVNENTLGVYGIHEVPVDFVVGQIRSVLDDIGTDAIKIGMLHSAELMSAVRDLLVEYKPANVVLDPVMVATSGDALMQGEAVRTLKEVLIPQVRVITPNLPEAETLLGCKIEVADFRDAAKALSHGGRVSVLLKAGHLPGDKIIDIFYNAEDDSFKELFNSRNKTPNTHGTGCTLSSAIAAFLAQGLQLKYAVIRAHGYLVRAIDLGAAYQIGKGHGPVHHFHDIWK